MQKIRIIAAALLMPLMASAQALLTNPGQDGVTGFATVADPTSASAKDGVTGGGNGKVVHVTTRADFEKYIQSNDPYVIILDADLTGKGLEDMDDEVQVGSNTTLVGGGSGHKLDGICLNISGKSNIIIRNIAIRKGHQDGIAMRTCDHVWIDHCDLSESYDGLLDFTVASDYMTVSWTKLSNHNKVSITNSGTCHYEDYGKEHVTFSHCWFANNTQRNPRIGYGRMHIYNCYWTDISSYCIGYHSQSQVLSEYNYFTKSANNPFMAQYTHDFPYGGRLTDKGSYYENGAANMYHCNTHGLCTEYAKYGITDFTPNDYYITIDKETTVSEVPEEVQAGVGPKEGLAYEPILCPGNGAINVPTNQKLSWGAIPGAVSSKIYLGPTEVHAMNAIDTDTPELEPGMIYLWKVVVTTEDGVEHSSPIYTFCTASAKALHPYPANKATDPWLRWPSSRDKFCTNMPLKWQRAADAKLYKVYASEDAATLDDNLIGETSALQHVAKNNFVLGKTYYWRVDAVKTDGTVVNGNVWSFSTPAKTLTVGKNETENMYRSGMAFTESNSVMSGGANSVGDQGPGSLIGTWNGAAGKYAISTAAWSQTLGKNLVGISVNGKLLDTWMTSTDRDTIEVRHSRHTVTLNPGDEIRVEFVAGYVDGGLNEARARIDYIDIEPTDLDIIEDARPSGIYHTPVFTPGLEWQNLKMTDVLFTDTLGTVGDYGSTQVKDEYASWITQNTESYTVYLKDAAMIQMDYATVPDASPSITTLHQFLDVTKSNAVEVAKSNEYGTLTALRLYKYIPEDTIYTKPVADSGKDYKLLLSPDLIFADTEGSFGVAGKTQVRKDFRPWVKYTNGSATEVQSNTRAAYIDPTTDKAVTWMQISGADGSTLGYVVGTAKFMNYYIKGCDKIKLYYTGSSSVNSGCMVKLTATEVPTTVTNASPLVTTATGGEANGKGRASSTVELSLDKTKQYEVQVSATAGDMFVYATKFWPAADVKGDVNEDYFVNKLDIDAVISVITGGDANSRADVNNSGTVDINDVNAVITIICKE